MTTCVVGIGQRFGGDDAWGLLVIDELERRALPGVALHRAKDASILIDLMAGDASLIVVDAIATEDARLGQLLELRPSQLDANAQDATSSHGIGVAQALELGKVLYGTEPEQCVRILALGIRPPANVSTETSPTTLAGIGRGADRVEEMVIRRHA